MMKSLWHFNAFHRLLELKQKNLLLHVEIADWIDFAISLKNVSGRKQVLGDSL